jgi:hypothetical protein
MAYCPSCAAQIAPDAARCPGCAAVFEDGSTWKPLPTPPVAPPPSAAGRVFSAIIKIIVVAASLAALALGGLFAAAEKNENAAILMLVVGIAVVALAVKARLRWTLLALLVAVPVGLATCATNFKWHGG